MHEGWTRNRMSTLVVDGRGVVHAGMGEQGKTRGGGYDLKLKN